MAGEQSVKGRGYAASGGGKPLDTAFSIAVRKAARAARAACHKIRFRLILRPSRVHLLMIGRARSRAAPDASESVLRGSTSSKNSCVVNYNFLIPTQGDSVDLQGMLALLMHCKPAHFLCFLWSLFSLLP